MKKILIILTLFLGLIGCENSENEFEDYDYTAAYFPYQYPMRTLVLGDDIYDNTNDNNHKFLISAAMGGVYANNKDRVFDIELAPELCNRVLFKSTLDTIRLMPAEYYTLSSNQLTIPAGKVNGNIEVQLTDAYFNDPLAIKFGYVIPLRLKASLDVDSILSGKSNSPNADPRVSESWLVPPKDFTMFGVKFINPYHGNFLHRGKDVIKSSSGSVVKEVIYREKHIEKDEVWTLKTSGRNDVDITAILNGGYRSATGPLSMRLSFNNDGDCTIKEAPGSTTAISGTGKFIKNAAEWGGKKRNVIVLSYNYATEVLSEPAGNIPAGLYTHEVNDTLVVRDRAVVMEVFSPIVF